MIDRWFDEADAADTADTADAANASCAQEDTAPPHAFAVHMTDAGAPRTERDIDAGQSADSESVDASAPEAPRWDDAHMPLQPPPAMEQSSGSDEAQQASPATPVVAETPWDADCERTYTFRAHGLDTPGDTSAYRVAAGAEEVRQFYFDIPWDGKTQLVKSRVIGSNPKVAHHWMLYSIDKSLFREGQILRAENLFDTLSSAAAQTLLVGGAGSSALEMPPGVGLRMPPAANRGFLFELHYFNGAGTEVEEDTSTLEVCVTHTLRPNEAAVHYLGRFDFQLPPHTKTDVRSTCRPSDLSEPVHLMAVAPHMHFTGSHAKIVLNRGSGEQVTLVDGPFTVQEQRSYRLPQDRTTEDVVVRRGDTLESTCGFDNPGDTAVPAGSLAQNEMCVMIVWAWPAGILQNDLPLGIKFGLSEDVDCMEF